MHPTNTQCNSDFSHQIKFKWISISISVKIFLRFDFTILCFYHSFVFTTQLLSSRAERNNYVFRGCMHSNSFIHISHFTVLYFTSFSLSYFSSPSSLIDWLHSVSKVSWIKGAGDMFHKSSSTKSENFIVSHFYLANCVALGWSCSGGKN